MSRRARPAVVLALAALAGAVSARPVLAHAGSLGSLTRSVAIPSWLTVLTTGAVVGAAFLFTSFMTDHDDMRTVNDWRRLVPGTAALAGVGRGLLSLAGLIGLGAVLVVGFVGPAEPTVNLAVLLVWAVWWAGYTVSVYLLGNTWPALNPWRTLARLVPTADRPYPERFGRWPATAGLLGLVFVEVVAPVGEDPPLLASLVAAYTVVTVAGATVYGDDWFEYVDPIAGVFRWYGRVAPFQRTDGGVAVGAPASELAAVPALDRDDVAFVVALLWVTTFDGLVLTPGWTALVTPVVEAGVPPLLVYFAGMVAGYGLFLGGYRLAIGRGRARADTYVTSDFLERWFAPSLVPIAAGYHLAHFLGYVLTFAPTVAAVAPVPLSPPAPAAVPVLVLPSWWNLLGLAFVLLGHVLAVWVAHARAFDLFPGRLAPIRSQYALVLVMVAYTMISSWIVAQPSVAPPFV